MSMPAEFILQIFIAFGAAGGVYAAIRADLREAIVKAEMAHRSADSAHKRIDQIQHYNHNMED